jgi:hypothetical protein
MRITESQIRQIIREELEMMALDEKGKDQDGDGDKDFDDVRIARFMKGGMDKDQARSKVKNHPMGK